jgi:hypothetical protein
VHHGVVRIRIEGNDLPGRSCAAGGDFPGYHDIHVGVQRRGRPSELLDLQPGDAATASWVFEATVDGTDVRSPYIQGGPGKRFIYLSWGTMPPGGAFELFRRAKLFLADVDPTVLSAADESGELVGRLGLTDGKGHPVCAWVRPPAVRWSEA